MTTRPWESRPQQRAARLLPAMVLALCLASCGGGGGSGGGGTPPSTALSLAGTAATGAAIAGKLVEAKCATGSGSATTGSDGRYSISIEGGNLPCLARVTAADGSVLHTVATSGTANITPATQLVVARLSGSDPAAFFAAFSPAVAATITSASVSLAQSAVVATLQGGAVDFSTIADLFVSPLVPALGGNAGNAYDVLLDALAARLAATGTTLAALTEAVAAQAEGLANPASPNALALLPPDALLRPAAAGCRALRSGFYRVLTPTVGASLAGQHLTMVLDAPTLTAVFSDGSTSRFTATAPCRFTDQAGQADVVVSQAGVVVARYTRDGGASFRMLLAVPDQTHALGTLAGTWNLVGLQSAAGAYTGVIATVTVDASGGQGTAAWCQNDFTWSVGNSADCGPLPMPGLRVSGSGGFEIVDSTTGTVRGRAFAYRAGNGDLMLAGVDANGSVQLRTRQRNIVLPAVGASGANWNVYTHATLASTLAVDQRANIVVSTDTAAQSWRRTQRNPGANDDHLETLFANNPRTGYILRQGGTAIAISGSLVTVNEFTGLPLRGMGLTALLLPALRQFDVSVVQP